MLEVKEVFNCHPDALPSEVLAANEPVIFRGLLRSWPLVKAGLSSAAEANQYLKSFYKDRTIGAYFGAPEIAGKLFYNEDMSAMNFENHFLKLDAVLDKITAHSEDLNPPTIYVGSTTLDICLPGLRAANDLAIPHDNPLVSIWISNKTRIPSHYDAPDNIACVAVGKRRFTLFPPHQIANLYPGPLDLTPAGQVISLVDFKNPDFEKFPRFRQALEHGMVAELEAGDALFLPSMWWHQVESLANFNVLINYWWRSVPDYRGQAVAVLKHALLSIRDLPDKEKDAWKHIFDHYVFGNAKQSIENIPEHAQGFLGPIDDISSRQLRAWLINQLNK
ncbi:MAG: cupin-like domain-containing protein [Gammaproteobacteria bacterium]|nr:MAG: cupin-like domain-containing protein [Gammaproteobacteria bacterium]